MARGRTPGSVIYPEMRKINALKKPDYRMARSVNPAWA
ncbi:hypothetical protein HCH_02474 [Hahella chejuensis KCTC 2396]|uniref:Uncharacterized protein n=1 Tax=Hahella chejuensis (strain KCTC 2396) TaxID=349521 RepID=Q2SJ94_HAHCH|nr:hypothetical protein HCH_02474 [Hahella chejuensis KCTC 2396]